MREPLPNVYEYKCVQLTKEQIREALLRQCKREHDRLTELGIEIPKPKKV